MKRTSFNQIEDFLECESFIHWAQELNGRENIFWEQWMECNPDKIELIEDAKALVKGIPFEPREIPSEQIASALFQLNSRIDRRSDRNKMRKRRAWVIAAAIALILGATSWTWVSELLNTVEYITDYGEWQTIELPDGSLVSLNAHSELKFIKKWEDGEPRQVWLEGEAFFDVVKMLDVGTAFKVITPDLDVEVLGTSFNVHSRGEQTKVYLQEGKVKLDLGDHITYMDPGDVVSYSARKEKIVDRRRTDAESLNPSAWTQGVINMKGAYAFDIFEKLEEIYGVEIRVKNEEIYTREYSVQLPMKKLEIVVPILERSMKVKITRKDQMLLLE
ncbi:MAG: FecR family protein [Saprospiraceae bacterium]|nr:FecR family protein [Saprospiraceae bacterium]